MGLYSKWQSIPVLLPGKSHGQRSLVGYSPWDHKESDTTERLQFTSLHFLVIKKKNLLDQIYETKGNIAQRFFFLKSNLSEFITHQKIQHSGIRIRKLNTDSI